MGRRRRRAFESGQYDFVLVNFANPDMVGHTGMLDAAIRAVETVDAASGKIVEAARARWEGRSSSPPTTATASS